MFKDFEKHLMLFLPLKLNRSNGEVGGGTTTIPPYSADDRSVSILGIASCSLVFLKFRFEIPIQSSSFSTVTRSKEMAEGIQDIQTKP